MEDSYKAMKEVESVHEKHRKRQEVCLKFRYVMLS